MKVNGQKSIVENNCIYFLLSGLILTNNDNI